MNISTIIIIILFCISSSVLLFKKFIKEKFSTFSINFMTFGGPSKNYHKAVKRITKEAEEFNIFNNIFGYTDNDLKSDNEFWEKHKNFIENNSRGYGYWIWKSYLIKKTLEKLKDNDILLYCDSGCVLNKKGIKRFHNYIDILNNSKLGILGFQMNYQPEKKWTKNAILKYFNCNNNEKILNSGQCIGGVVFIKKNKYSVNFINKWYDITSNYDLVNDKIEKKEHSEFIENRHDQSIFSILAKTEDCVLIPDETYVVAGKHFKDEYPIWAKRQK